MKTDQDPPIDPQDAADDAAGPGLFSREHAASSEASEGVRLFRRFVVLALVSTIAVLVLAGFGLRAVLQRATLTHSQVDAAQASLAMRDIELSSLVAALNAQAMGAGAEQAAAMRRALRVEFQPFLGAFDLEAVRIYGPEGVAIFALYEGALGRRDPEEHRFRAALAGETLTGEVSKTRPREPDERWGQDVSAIATYIPIRVESGDAGDRIVGVLKITQNATKEYAASDAVLTRSVLVLAAVLVAVFSVLSAIMFRAQQTIRAKAHDLAEERARTREEAALRAMQDRLHAAERLASIGALAAGVGHDLNNLLLPMRGQLRSLDASELPDAARQQVGALRESIEFLRQLGDNLRVIAGGGESAQPDASTDVAAWWKQVGPMLSRAIPKKAALTVEIDPGLPPVATSAPRLTQAMLNLLVNAGDALEGADAPTVRMWATHGAHDGTVEIGVRDNGRGMPAEVARRAFDPFFTTKRRGASTGLGLALVQGVASSCGGSVALRSEPGSGTEIVMRLPAATTAAALAPVRNPDAAAPVASVSIDDDRVGGYACAVLREAGFHVSRTPEGDPGPATLWITEPGERAIAAARTFLQAGSSKRVIVLGEATPEWRDAGAVALGAVLDQDSLLRALETAGLLHTGEDA